ncbi:MAG: cytochrome c [Gammaproteobacteria bacterium]|nr:cytochrome c [Gammaproteobacteria bacterium]
MFFLNNTRSTSFLKFIPIAFTLCIMTSPVLAGDATAGKAIYDGAGACASCHGATGAGDGVASAAFNPKPASFVSGAFRLDTDGDGDIGSDTDLNNVIKNGAAKYGGNAGMPARPDLSDAQISDLVAYIRTLKK